MTRPDAELIVDEFRWVGDMLRLACRLGIARLQAEPNAPLSALAPEVRAALAEELHPLIKRHREIWLQRNRLGGLEDSTARLERTLALLAE
jgi:hexosaminidase